MLFLQGVFEHLEEFEGGKLGIKSEFRYHSYHIMIIKNPSFKVSDEINRKNGLTFCKSIKKNEVFLYNFRMSRKVNCLPKFR